MGIAAIAIGAPTTGAANKGGAAATGGAATAADAMSIRRSSSLWNSIKGSRQGRSSRIAAPEGVATIGAAATASADRRPEQLT